jgi:hypothetical protein
MTINKHLIIVGFGPVAGYKYSRSIRAAIERGELDGYSVVDVDSERRTVLGRLSQLPIPPSRVFFIPDPPKSGSYANVADFDQVVKSLGADHGTLQAFISTEPKAHEAYLRYCIDNDIDSIVTKPVVLPMCDGQFDTRCSCRQ